MRRALTPLLFARAVTALAGVPAPKKVVFLGTPPVAARSLELLLEGSRAGRGGGFDIAAVVSQPPTRSGRKMKLTPSPVQQLAEAEGLPILTPATAKDDEFLSALGDIAPDLCITAAYGCFLPQRFLDLPVHGTLNIHPSLLPLYRGAAPIQRCLEAGDAATGVSVAFTVLKMDAGPILRQVTRPLDGSEQAPDLLMEMFEAGTEQLLQALPSVWDGSCEEAKRAQDNALATPAPKVSKDEAEVRLDALSARAIHHRCRGFAGWPGIWTELDLGDGKPPVRAKLLETRVAADGAADGAAPQITLRGDGKALVLPCTDGSVLEVTRLTLPGKKPVDAKAFWNGLNGRDVSWVGGGAVLQEEEPPSPPPPAAPRGAATVSAAAPSGFKWGGTY